MHLRTPAAELPPDDLRIDLLRVRDEDPRGREGRENPRRPGPAGRRRAQALRGRRGPLRTPDRGGRRLMADEHMADRLAANR